MSLLSVIRYYERVQGDPSLPRGTHGKKLQYCYLWCLKEAGSGDIIGEIHLKRRPEQEAAKRLQYRTKKFKKKHPKVRRWVDSCVLACVRAYAQ